MSKRKEAIEAKLAKETTVDFQEIQADDKFSLEGLLHSEERNLYTLTKDVNNFVSNPQMTLGTEFISLLEKKAASEKRVKTIKGAIDLYV